MAAIPSNPLSRLSANNPLGLDPTAGQSRFPAASQALGLNPNPAYKIPGLTPTAAPASTPATAPAKADAAINATATMQGLMASLNKFEQELVSKGTFDVPNEYSIEFAPETMASSKVVKDGNVEKTFTPMAPTNPDQLDPDKQSMNTKQRTWSADAGTPIVQFIDQVMRSSSYIMDQAKYIVDEVTQEVKEQKTLKTLAWYKINIDVTRKQPFDKARNGYAYKIKFIITPYNINNSYSEYFPAGEFRGVHKSYNYWFTGQNIEILNFEQELNAVFHQTISNPDIKLWAEDTFNNKLLVQRSFQTRSQQNDQGAEGRANEAAANLADTIYSPADQGQVRLKIIGDPAWLQQGEAAGVIGASTFTWSPFLADGTINFDAAQILFDVSWNQPVDYNLQTGIMDTGASNLNANRSAGQAGDARQNYTYRATTVTSHFKQGRFEQELVGVLFPLPTPASQKDSARPNSSAGTPPATPTAGDGSGAPQAAVGEGVIQAQQASGTDSTAFTNTRQPNLLSPAVAQAASGGNPSTSVDNTTDTPPAVQESAPLPAESGQAPTSNADIEFITPNRARLSQAVNDIQLSSNTQIIDREA